MSIKEAFSRSPRIPAGDGVAILRPGENPWNSAQVRKALAPNRRAGREPMLSIEISSSGLAAWK